MKRKSPAPKKPSKSLSLYERLSAPIPHEFLDFIPPGRYDNPNVCWSIRNSYVRERLNVECGVSGWRMDKPEVKTFRTALQDKHSRPEFHSTARVTISIPALKKKFHGEGGFSNYDPGDSRKGAVSDAMGNALKDLIGKEVYLGLVPPDIKLGQGSNAEKSHFMLGVEFGFRQRENGHSFESALELARKEWDGYKP